ncbi:glutamine-hydrolyzing GMP synthase, partial [Candidatus Peregrinibacteria bacterium]|nr:glutamine-hydrolyzing GMP synthase [Candidatus Peregrinibacteria bacterium]
MVHKGSTGPEHDRRIVILDFGGQYAHLIGSRIRRLGAYSEIREPEIDPEELKGAAGIILSGGPQSVYGKGSPQANPKILALGIPVLGLCYGHQWVAHALGGTVAPAKTKEYGETKIRVV